MPFLQILYLWNSLKKTVVTLIALKEGLFKYLGMGLSLDDVETERCRKNRNLDVTFFGDAICEKS